MPRTAKTKATAKATATATAKSTANPKKRGSSSVPQQALAHVSLTLTDLPEKTKESWSLREAIEQLQEPITIAMQRGYRYEEIVEVLASCNIHITASSLKRYLSIAKRSAGAKPRRRTQSAPASSALASNSTQSADASAPDLASVIEMEPRRRGRAASATKTSAAKTAAKAKAAPRTTTTRKRRQSS